MMGCCDSTERKFDTPNIEHKAAEQQLNANAHSKAESLLSEETKDQPSQKEGHATDG